MTTAPSAISTPPVSDSGRVSHRVVSLDVFRGLAVAGMILVTDPGTYSAVYWPLLHAEWNGWTPTDMIFPGFLFAVGIAITFSLASRLQRGDNRGKLAGHIAVRSVVIFLLGLAVNGFPDYNLHAIRIPGVLQRIALCYLVAALLYLVSMPAEDAKRSKPRRITFIATIAAVLLAVYWTLMKLVPVPGFGPGRLDSLGNLGAYIDRALLGTRHMWAYGTTPGYGVTFDPEGLLSTIPAIASVLFGILAGEWLSSESSNSHKALGLAAAGLVLALAGCLLHPLLPMNKKIWTSTFVLFSGGVSLLAFSVLYWLLDIRRQHWWAPTALVLGTNAILAFVLSNVITTLTDRIHVGAAGMTLHQWGYHYGFATWLQPVHASLAYAIVIVLLNIGIVYPLYRRRIFLRV